MWEMRGKNKLSNHGRGAGSATIQILVVLNNVFRMWLFTNAFLECLAFASLVPSSPASLETVLCICPLPYTGRNSFQSRSLFFPSETTLRLMGDHTAVLLTYNENSPISLVKPSSLPSQLPSLFLLSLSFLSPPLLLLLFFWK